MPIPFDIPLDVVAMIGFFVIVGILIIFDRKNIDFHYGLVIRRWKHGRQVMDKWIFSHKKFLSVFGTVGVIVGVIASVVGLSVIIYYSIIGQQAVALVLPTAGGFEYPTSAIIGVPFWFWIIAVFVVLTVHEPMHAIFSRLAGVPVRSWGIMTLLVIPIGAFVDPDMKKVQKLKFGQKMKIFAGGSFGNFITGGIVIVILLLMSATFYAQTQSTLAGTPAAEAGVEGTLISVNGIGTGDLNQLSEVLNNIPAGTQVEVVTEQGTFQVTTSSPPNGGTGSYLGIGFGTGLKPQYVPFNDIILTFSQLFFWLFLFNIGVGIFNMLPMKPFDGGHMFEAIFVKIFKDPKIANKMINITSIIVFIIFLFSIFGASLGLALPI